MGEISQNSNLCGQNIYRTINIKKIVHSVQILGLKRHRETGQLAHSPAFHHKLFSFGCRHLFLDLCSDINNQGQIER